LDGLPSFSAISRSRFAHDDGELAFPIDGVDGSAEENRLFWCVCGHIPQLLALFA
jgi:hypothetical protein